MKGFLGDCFGGRKWKKVSSASCDLEMLVWISVTVVILLYFDE